MEFLIFIGCAVTGALVYFGIVKPIARLFAPLTSRIPTGSEYRARIGARS